MPNVYITLTLRCSECGAVLADGRVDAEQEDMNAQRMALTCSCGVITAVHSMICADGIAITTNISDADGRVWRRVLDDRPITIDDVIAVSKLTDQQLIPVKPTKKRL